MSELIMVVGGTGTGKSTAMRNLDPKETFVINVAEKPLPIRGYKKNYTPFTTNKDGSCVGNMVNTSNPAVIAKILAHIDKKRPEINAVIVDDSTYIMGFSNMDKVDDAGFKKFTQMAKEMYDVAKASKGMRDDLKVVFNGHDEIIEKGGKTIRKYKTVGQFFDNVITMEGLFTWVFFTNVNKIEDEEGNVSFQYRFETNTDGETTAKSSMGCFDDFYIDNDLAYVFQKIDEYNNGED